MHLFIYLFHKSIWHQSRVGPCGRTKCYRKKKRKILESKCCKKKNLFNKQKQYNFTTFFHNFQTNDEYGPRSQKRKQKKSKTTFISVKPSFASVQSSQCSFEHILWICVLYNQRCFFNHPVMSRLTVLPLHTNLKQLSKVWNMINSQD